MAQESRLPDFAPGTRIGSYEIQGLLGRGGMGTVYRGVHPQIGKRVAIKVLAARHCKDQEFATRFVREAQVVNRIDHPGLVDIFSFGQTPEGHLYLVMELLEGEHLGARLERGPMPWGELLSIFCQILDAVQAAHDAGVIHRDLKPENIFLVNAHAHAHAGPGRVEGLQVKVLDFGLAKVQGGELTHTGIALGTPRYMAPEQCRGRHIDPRADLYSVGLMLYEAVTGRFPFHAHSPLEMLTLQLMEPPPPPSRFARMPAELEEVILRAVQKRPEDRFGSALEMAAALAEVAPPNARVELRRIPPGGAEPAPAPAPARGPERSFTQEQGAQIGYQPTAMVGVPSASEAPHVAQSLAPVLPAPPALTLRGPPPPRAMRVKTVLGSSALVLIGVVIGASLQPLLGWMLRGGQAGTVALPAAESIAAGTTAPVQPALALLAPPPGAGVLPIAAPPPQTGALVVSCQTPEGEAEPIIRVDGRRRAEGCDVRIGDLTPGPHKVTVSGSVRLRKRITIAAGGEVTVRADPDGGGGGRAYQGRAARRPM